MGQRGFAGEHLYAHFCKADHKGTKNISMKIQHVGKDLGLTNWTHPKWFEPEGFYMLLFFGSFLQNFII